MQEVSTAGMERCSMTVTIRCEVCKKTFFVRGESLRPNEYSIHEDADLSGTCPHIQNDIMVAYPIDCEVDD